MTENIENDETRFEVKQDLYHEDQREKDRRQEACEGYCYISTVGWICRRERFRRRNVAQIG